MKKVIIAFDNLSFSESALDYAIKLNEIEPILLIGVFLPQSTISALWSYAGAVPGGMFIPLMEPESTEEIKKHIDIFARICKHNYIDYRIHKDFSDFSIPELVRESRFADLILLGSDAFYQRQNDKEPNAYIKQVLHDVECPVLLFPDKAVFPEHNILAYDGSADSVYAIKQFAYLFRSLTAKPTYLIYINNDDEKEMPEKANIEELVARHFSDLEIRRLAFNPRKYLATWVEDRPASILVTGSYARPGISTLFSPSFVTKVVTDQKVPLFIAHR